MRYDASRFEKPQGAYQTIHEDGKTYYELPEKEQAPAVLPETKAVLEKNGMIRLRKYTRKLLKREAYRSKRRKRNRRTKKNTGKRYADGKGKKISNSMV